MVSGRKTRRLMWAAPLLSLLVVSAVARGSIAGGQVDTFQSGTTLGWLHGVNSVTPPTVVTSGGPLGANDAYLQSISTGGARAESKQVVFNSDQWTGDYTQAGVTTITAQMIDFGPSPLSMRLTIQDTVGTKWSSTNAIALPADSQWHAMTFDVSPAGWSLVSGTQSIQTSLANVTELRILSAAAGPAYIADTVASTLGIDNITAVPEPGALAPLVGTIALVWRRRRAP